MNTVVIVAPFRGPFFKAERFIQSLFSQENPNWVCHFIDDNSEWTPEERKNIHALVDSDHRITLHENSERQGPLHNIYNVIVNFLTGDDTIIAQADGDDWLLPNAVRVILDLHEVYDITYGQYVRYAPGKEWHNALGQCQWYPLPLRLDRKYENYPYVASHLKSFKRKNFLKVPYDMFIDPKTGNFWNSSYDKSYMIPMMKLTETPLVGFNTIPIYVYDMENWPSGHVHPSVQEETSKRILASIEFFVNQGKSYDQIKDSIPGGNPEST